MDLPLDPIEVRVLGSLVEKELSTPDYYPMTLNALTNACNQKSNRDPVLALAAEEVQYALEALRKRGLAGTASGAGSRATKYRHALREALGFGDAACTVLASLMLRGPQTVGEIRTRTSRMHAFDDLDAVAQHLQTLSEHAPPLVVELPRQPGQKERRFMHLLAGEPDPEALDTSTPALPGGGRLAGLEAEVAGLREEVAHLREAFEAFRAQFE